MKRIKYILYLLMVVMTMAGCTDPIVPIGEGDIEAGDKVMFTTLVPDASSTTRTAKDVWQTKVDSFKPVQLNYQFTVEMWKEGAAQATASNTYRPTRHTNEGAPVIENYDGTLQSTGTTEIYWQDNHNSWGFKAEANNNPLVTDQSSQEKWLSMDYLTGHSYLPIWTGDDNAGSGTNPEVIQYKTNKEWYAGNKAVMDAAGIMPESTDAYKKVPLYMKHQRAWITIVLRAGEGVAREALQYLTSKENIQTTINSYAEGSSEVQGIDQPWSRETFIDYTEDKNGAAQSHVSTTRYDAIVMPHNYATKKDEEKIAMINLSGQKFSFYAGNDERYFSGSKYNPDAANSAYNLEAGKHLIIEATLSRESRKILITAWIEDWTEVATQTICDDYGQNGDPVVIKSRKELIDFLKNEKVNKQGNVGIIQPPELKLDVETTDDPEKYPLIWPSGYDLNATLNLAGCILKTNHQLFRNMASSANLVNGTVQIGDSATIDCAIANTNNGTIERINVTTTSELSTAKATIAGMVKENHGTIYQCTSTLTVSGTEGYTHNESKYVGGIAAVSISPDGSMAVIDGCTVNASVNGSGSSVLGGGIVGYVTGRVSSNTFEYGITVSQDATKFKNIFAQAGSDAVRAFGNEWPTKVDNLIGSSAGTNPNTYPEPRYDAVFDSQAELDKILTDQTNYNAPGKLCRISKSFEVVSTNDEETDWTHGTVDATNHSAGTNNVSFTLDGNHKTITLTGTKTVTTTTGKNLSDGEVTTYTTGPMLFNCILGEVKDLNIYLDQSLVASPTEGTNTQSQQVYNAQDAIAPLAYAVYGANAKLTNVNVKANAEAYVQASTAAGLVVWAYGGATIENCKVNVPVRMWLPTSMGGDAKHYSGGIVGVAAKATISQCWYLGNTETSVSGSYYSTSAKRSSNYYYGGIVGGTSQKENEEPELAITDCASWFIATKPAADATDQSSKGGIIGYCCYAENGSASMVRNGMKLEGNEGNWWQLSAVGASYWLSGLTEEKVIGRRNGITPTYNENF